MSEKDTSRLCIHTITTKPWPLAKALEQYERAGVQGVSVWQNAVEDTGLQRTAQLLQNSSLQVVSYVRGGFFPALDDIGRKQAISNNKKLLDEAAVIGAPLLVLVCGAEPGLSLEESRSQIQAGIEAILPHAQSLNIKLGIEPLHPMYADTRSAINTLAQANDLAEAINDRYLGIVVDVYHLWWDPALQSEIARCGANEHLFAYHICDWRVPTTDMLNDRGLMGEGCIPLNEIGEWVKAAGFQGFQEVEIFSDRYWSMEQELFLKEIVEAYLAI